MRYFFLAPSFLCINVLCSIRSNLPLFKFLLLFLSHFLSKVTFGSTAPSRDYQPPYCTFLFRSKSIFIVRILSEGIYGTEDIRRVLKFKFQSLSTKNLAEKYLLTFLNYTSCGKIVSFGSF